MSPKVEEKKSTELTEKDVLEIIKEGDKELREGKTENMESFLEREYPQYVSRNRIIKKV